MTDAVTLNVEYSCRGCQIHGRQVAVRERRGIEEDVRDWVRLVQELVSIDHQQMSVRCRAASFDLKIPLTSNEIIGKARRQ